MSKGYPSLLGLTSRPRPTQRTQSKPESFIPPPPQIAPPGMSADHRDVIAGKYYIPE